MSRQAPVQSVRPAWQVRAQTPLEQTSPEAHAFAQPPQWEGSAWRSVHTPLQADKPAWQETWQTPPAQTCPALHAARQAPQLAKSEVVSRQEPEQSVSPTSQESWHLPLEQTSPALQAAPHAPQFAGSEVKSRQTSPQAVIPPVQTTLQTPLLHACPDPQAVAQAPQLAESLVRSTHMLPHLVFALVQSPLVPPPHPVDSKANMLLARASNTFIHSLRSIVVLLLRCIGFLWRFSRRPHLPHAPPCIAPFFSWASHPKHPPCPGCRREWRTGLAPVIHRRSFAPREIRLADALTAASQIEPTQPCGGSTRPGERSLFGRVRRVCRVHVRAHGRQRAQVHRQERHQSTRHHLCWRHDDGHPGRAQDRAGHRQSRAPTGRRLPTILHYAGSRMREARDRVHLCPPAARD